jgi:hypothetical protein
MRAKGKRHVHLLRTPSRLLHSRRSGIEHRRAVEPTTPGALWRGRKAFDE